MTAIKYRMNAGSAGDVNRSHPASIQPRLNHITTPVPFYGSACMFGSGNSVRAMAAGDTTATVIAGVAVRPFPFQTRTGSDSAAYGASSPQQGAIDVLNWGHILMPTVGTPALGAPVFIWVAVSGGGHVQGGAEAAVSAGNTAALTGAYFNGPPDSQGLCEVVISAP